MKSTLESISQLRSRRTLVVGEIHETSDVKTFILRVNREYSALPGQFNMIYYWGIGEVPLSIANMPIVREHYTIVEHTVKAIGTVTRALVKFTKTGSIVGLRGPYGRGWPLREYEDFNVLLVAGGLGLAPIRPVIKYIESRRDSYGLLYILYGARTPSDMLYRYEYEYYSKIPGTKLMLSSDIKTEGWRHHVGLVTDLITLVDIDPSNTVAFICGPEVMMKTTARKLMEKGFRKDRIYLSLERRMRCGIRICGTCQLGPLFVCENGPVFSYEEVEDLLQVKGV